tara:strand:+ start:864 stop:1175 length:312 start_codon:yes stop_codon:yes gene_type:complete
MDDLTLRQRILTIVKEIPEGCVATYGQVAKLAGLPGYARVVGQALNKLPSDTQLPWHRVISASGRMSLSEDSDAFLEQKEKLLSDGITIQETRIDLKEYQWQP